MSSSSRWIVDAMVASRTGSASSPPWTIRPSTPTEKSPDTGLTPEWSPAIDVTNSAVLDRRRAPPRACRCRAPRPAPPPRRAGVDDTPARRRARGRGARAAARVGVVEEALEHTVDHELVATAGQALAVVRLGAERARVGGVVDEGEQRRGDHLADAVGERRPALQHRLAVEHAADDPEDRGGHPRLEHERDPLGGGLGRAEQAGGAEDGVVGRLVDRRGR